MKIKRALSTNTHKSVLIHVDKQIEFTTYETQLEVIKSYSKHKHGFESHLAKGGLVPHTRKAKIHNFRH